MTGQCLHGVSDPCRRKECRRAAFAAKVVAINDAGAPDMLGGDAALGDPWALDRIELGLRVTVALHAPEAFPCPA